MNIIGEHPSGEEVFRAIIKLKGNDALLTESLAKFPRRTTATSGFHGQTQQTEGQLQQQQSQQQTMGQNSSNDHSSVQATAMQVTSSNGVPSVNNSLNSASTTSPSSTIVGLLHQNSMNSRQQNPMNNATNGSPYGGSSSIHQIPSPTPSSSNNALQSSHGGGLTAAAAHMSSASSPNISMQQPALSGDADQNDSQSSVQKIIHEMMMSSQLNGGGGMVGVGTLGGKDVKNINGILSGTNSRGLVNGGNGLVGNNGSANSNAGMGGGGGFGTMSGSGFAQSAMLNGIRAAMGNNNNSLLMNGRVGTTMMTRDQNMNHQQALGDQLLSGLGGAVNGGGFNNVQFDWKSSP
ncbi:hypothetical protein U1Q18_037270 [Sarracenia purpurea var. burkii]